MTAYLAIRDDDISHFTKPEMVQKVHRKAIDGGFKLSFAVIPHIECSMDLCVPPQYRRLKSRKCVGHEIVSYIKSIGGDVLLHGYNHSFGFPEFRERNRDLVRFKVEAGKKLLGGLFGKNPKVFVPPQEDVSREAWGVLSEEGMAICRTLSFAGWMRKTPLRFVPLLPSLKHLLMHPRFFYRKNPVRKHMRRTGGTLEFQTSAGFSTLRSSDIELKRAMKALDEAVEKDDLCQIAMHSWEFFENWDMDKPRTQLLNAYNAFLEYASKCDIVPITLTELAEGFGY